MSSSRSGNTNGQQGGGGDQHHEEQDEEESLGHDSSTAMSLDESSIALNATGIQSVDVSTSFAARGSRKSNAATSAAAPPIFSPLADSMSMSGIDTPMTLQSAKGNVNNNGSEILMMNGTSSKNNSMPMNGNGNSNNNGAAKTVAAVGKKKPLSINLPNYSSNDSKTPQKLAPSSSTSCGDWNNSNNWNIQNARLQLRRASRECNRRGLKLASRWASEQLMGLAVVPSQNNNQTTNSNSMMLDQHESLALPPEECCQPNDMELYAMSLFDLGEYSRAAHILSIPASSAHNTATSPSSDGSLGQINPPRKNLTPLGIYLRAFSLYLEGERRKEEQVTELRDPLERTSLHNSNLPRLEAELRRANSLGNLDAFGLYVYGVVLKGLRGTRRAPTLNSEKNSTAIADKTEGQQAEGDVAHRILVRSILAYPFNWSAWLDLGELCVDDPSIDTEVEELLLPIADHWMYHFFCVHVFIENKANENAIAIIEKLANGNGNTTILVDEEDEEDGNVDNAAVSQSSGFFVQSAYLQSQLAMAYYDVRDYDSAHEHFLALSEREPYRLDHMDAFSNVLYVKDQKVALSHLAHRAVTVDKYRPETCIIVGNYYSSKGRHEKAVQYFQRALKLDRTYLSAWTLLGHEYIEMKNTAAAIEAYRRAVDISDREYRAWYGLGQTYEIMNMLLHALFYFRKAASLHPHDARMWCAIGGCLLGLDRRTDAEKSYERAVSLGDGEGIATRKLAELYREDGDEEKAAKCYLRHLELRYQSQLPGSFSGASADTSPEAFEAVVKNVRVDEPEAEALLYLAYYYRDNLEYDQAILCATRLEDYPGPEKEQGKGLLRDIRSRMDQAGEKKKSKASSSLSPTTPANVRTLRSGRNLSLDSRSAEQSSFEFSP